nr:MAG TPA: Terminase large subunit [Caudoviricetes sp.]
MPVAKSSLKVRPQQQISDKKLKEILEEDKRRLKSLLASYRPITGENAPGLRFECVITDFLNGKKLWLPVEMLKEKKFCAIIKCGSIEAFCDKYMPDFDQEKARDAVFRYLIRLRCKHDFYFFAYAYARIKNKDGGEDIPFLLRNAQIKLAKVFEQLRLHSQYHYIRVILLKCRQWGGSTLTDIYMAWLQIFWKTNWNSNIVGHQSSSATQVFDMYEKLINAIPTWLFYDIGQPFKSDTRKLKTSGTIQNIKYFIPRSCKIQTGSARNPESCRSGDAALAHITEEAFFPNTTEWTPAKVIKAASSSIQPDPLTFIVRESTPNGRENEFHDAWVAANSVDKDGKPLSAFTPVFVAWFEIEKYILPFASEDERADFAIWLWENRNDEQGHGKYYWWLYECKGASFEGIHWYIEKSKEYETLDDMRQEFPSDDVEAFLFSGTTVFDPYKLKEMEEDCKGIEPIMVGDIEGDSYDAADDACMDNIRFIERSGGPLKVWAGPDNSEIVRNRYIVACDIGGSHKTSDFSDIVVLDRYDEIYGGVPEIVAEWHGHCDADQLAMRCAQIAHFYNDAYLVIENNTAYSRMNNTEGNQSELFFPILLPLYNNLYSASQSKLKKVKNIEMKWGFNTNKNTKVAVVKTMARIIRDGGYMERELAAIDECTYFLYYKQNDCYGAVAGKHDDRVMARAIALYVEKDMPAPEIVPFRSKAEIERERLRNRPPVVADLAGIGGGS